MPLMAMTSWPMISGRSGLPKLRLSVRPAVRRRGGQVAPAFGDGLLAALVGVGLDIARRDVGGEGQRLVSCPSTRTTPASPPGICSGLALDQRVILLPDPAAEALLGEPSRSSSAGRNPPARRHRRRATADLAQGRSYSGASSPSSLIGRLATSSPWCRMRKRRSSVVLPTMAKSRPHLTKIALARLPFPARAP
jgi:hypothetical protein